MTCFCYFTIGLAFASSEYVWKFECLLVNLFRHTLKFGFLLLFHIGGFVPEEDEFEQFECLFCFVFFFHVGGLFQKKKEDESQQR